MMNHTIIIGSVIIIINLIPLLIKKYKLISLTSIISLILMGLYLGGII